MAWPADVTNFCEWPPNANTMGIWVRRRLSRGPTAWISAYQGRPIAASESPPCQQQRPTLSTRHVYFSRRLTGYLTGSWLHYNLSIWRVSFIFFSYRKGTYPGYEFAFFYLESLTRTAPFMEYLMHRHGILHNRAFDGRKGTLQWRGSTSLGFMVMPQRAPTSQKLATE